MSTIKLLAQSNIFDINIQILYLCFALGRFKKWDLYWNWISWLSTGFCRIIMRRHPIYESKPSIINHSKHTMVEWWMYRAVYSILSQVVHDWITRLFNKHHTIWYWIYWTIDSESKEPQLRPIDSIPDRVMSVSYTHLTLPTKA